MPATSLQIPDLAASPTLHNSKRWILLIFFNRGGPGAAESTNPVSDIRREHAIAR